MTHDPFHINKIGTVGEQIKWSPKIVQKATKQGDEIKMGPQNDLICKQRIQLSFDCPHGLFSKQRMHFTTPKSIQQM